MRNLKLVATLLALLQMRLDLHLFVLAGPLVDSTSTTKLIGGVPAPGRPSAKKAAPTSQCLSDAFSVTSPAAAGVGVICGTNTGEHRAWSPTNISCIPHHNFLFISSVYVDPGGGCISLNFLIGPSPIVRRQWSIKAMCSKSHEDFTT